MTEHPVADTRNPNAGRNPNASRFRHARLYITFRCNARCGYCNVWQDPVFAGQPELDADGLRRCIDQLAALGVNYLDVTGGEPALHRELSAAVQHARQLGMAVEVTTNAIRFSHDMDAVVPYVSTLNISLDTLSAQRYHAIRGTDTLDRTVALVERLRREWPEAPVKLITVVTGENLADLDEVVGFAQTHRVPVYLSPMFQYFGAQRATRDPARTARSIHVTRVNGREPLVAELAELHSQPAVDAVRRRMYQPFTAMDLALLRHLETIDPSTRTSCGAGTRIITVGPAGQLLLPCYHEWDGSLAWDRPYRQLVRDPEFLRVVRDEVGERPGCRRCAVYPYLGLATSYQCTSEFLVQAVSAELGKIKALLDRALPRRAAMLEPTHDALRLLDRLQRLSLDGAVGVDERYPVQAEPGVGARSSLSAEPVAVEELLSDHAGEDCWRVQRTPHRLVRALYLQVLPALIRLGQPPAWTLAGQAPAVQLALWQVLLDLLGAAGSALPRDRECAVRWCQDTAELLADARAEVATAALNGLGALVGVPAPALRSTGGLAADPERLLVAKFARRLPAARRHELADLLPTPGRPSPDDPVAELADAELADAEQADGELADAELTDADLSAAATWDHRAVDRLCQHADLLARAGDTAALRALLGRWNRSVDQTIGARSANQLQDALLARELSTQAVGC
ncbi:MAG TPA: radical SAM protein [Jatrophihabitans sp.]|nr:radical SAM protein [Jatrophihabitans sp.]